MNDTALPLSLPEHSETVLSFLETRRSNLAKTMNGPGPTKDELTRMLEIAARVPDHRKLTPWRFIIFQGGARADMGQHIGTAFKKENPDMPLDRIMFEAARFQRAPLVIAVVSSPKECKRGTPEWEQKLSAGIVCYNLCLAAQASGFGAQWLTEWLSYNDDVTRAMGVLETEKVAGLIYIGTPSDPPQRRARPDLDHLVTLWD